MSYRGNPPYYVPAAWFKPILADLIHQAGEDQVTEKADGTVIIERKGGVEDIARQMPHFIEGVKETSVPRRLWSIMNDETFRVSTEVADAILMTQNLHIDHDTDLPTFPAQLEAGREMVRCHNDISDDPINVFETDAFVRSMIRFCKGFSIGMALDLEEAMDFAQEKAKARGEVKKAVA